jgi:hypothetical protein
VFWRLPSGYPPSRTDPSGKWPPLPRLRASKAPTLGKKPRAAQDPLASARRRRWSITPFPNTTPIFKMVELVFAPEGQPERGPVLPCRATM